MNHAVHASHQRPELVEVGDAALDALCTVDGLVAGQIQHADTVSVAQQPLDGGATHLTHASCDQNAHRPSAESLYGSNVTTLERVLA